MGLKIEGSNPEIKLYIFTSRDNKVLILYKKKQLNNFLYIKVIFINFFALNVLFLTKCTVLICTKRYRLLLFA